MKYYITFIFVFLNIILLPANQAALKILEGSEFKSANISISIRDLKSNSEICNHRPDNLTIPASTMKVITTATALEILGPDFKFETRLSYSGFITKEGILKGNLYIQGGGDPTLGSSKLGNKDFLTSWVTAVQKCGIKKIEGNVIADESLFDDEGVNPKWTWEDIGNYYAPGIYALAYRDNTLQVTFKTGNAGTAAEIVSISPDIPGLVIDNKLMSSTINFDSAWFYGAPKSLHRTVRGAIPMNKSAFVVKADIPDPAGLLVTDFKSKLNESGIEINGNKEFFDAKKMIFYVHYSVPLASLITETNQKSNNLYAEQIFKSLSINSGQPAGNNSSLNIIRNYWKSKGLDIEQLAQADGSGLSPLNAVSASFMTGLLVYMYNKSPYKNEFINSLSVSGKSGTLSGMFVNTPLEGKVFGKSGTISKVRCYTGYIFTENKKLAFTCMVNNYRGKSADMAKRIEDLLLKITKM